MSIIPASDKLPTVRQVLRLYNVRRVKHLAQNFIFDTWLTDKIARFLGLTVSNNLVIEIGSGPGTLTRSILKLKPKFFALIEKDTRYGPILEDLKKASNSNMHIFMHDALLTVPFQEISSAAQDFLSTKSIGKIQLIGNLPFNVATPMHIQWLQWISEKSMELFSKGLPIEMILMFQKEVARRIVAQPGADNYGRLAVISQLFSNVRYLTTVPAKFFTPKPDVDAGLVSFEAKSTNTCSLKFDEIEKLTNIIFRHPNKTIQNNLKIKLGPEIFAQIQPAISNEVLPLIPRDLPLEQFVEIGRIMQPILPTIKL